jgi:ATP/maltotriose-dependent transcriptional regulator MalT
MFSQGELTRAHAVAEECILLDGEKGTENALVEMFPFLGEKTFYQNNYRSRSFLARRTSALLGEIIFYQGDTSTARLVFEKSRAFYKEVGDETQLSMTLHLLARVIAAQGDLAAARALYEESLNRGRGVKFTLSFLDIPPALEGLAAVVAAQGEPTWAARLWGAAESQRESYGTPLAPIYRAGYEQAVAKASIQLGEKTFAAAWYEGRMMTLEQVLAAKGTAEILAPKAMEPSSPSLAQMQPISPAGLTTRELEVLRLVAQGLTDAQVAQQLVISPRTVNSHLTSIYSKLGVDSRTAATHYVMEHHLI